MKKIFTFRFIAQIFVFSFLIFLSLSHLKYGVEKTASIDAYCPYGAVESFLTKVTTGDYLRRIWTSSFILMAITILVTFIFGRVFCSYFCPLGSIQEWIRALGRKLGIKKDVELPKSIDQYARYLKYLVLVLVVYFSYALGDLFFRNYDPYNALMHFGNEWDEKIVAYLILLLIFVSALFSKSWWCRYLCPLGAFLGIIKKISPFKIKRDKNTCVSCGECDRVCPANLDIMNSDSVNSPDCTSCLSCVNDCPKNSLSASIFGKKISKKLFGIIAVIAFFLPLLIISLTPLWQTKAPSNIINSQSKVDVANIRGSNSLANVIKETGVPLSVFVRELGVPEDIDTSLLLKEIGIKYDLKNKAGDPLETQDFRDVISLEIEAR